MLPQHLSSENLTVLNEFWCLSVRKELLLSFRRQVDKIKCFHRDILKAIYIQEY